MARIIITIEDICDDVIVGIKLDPPFKDGDKPTPAHGMLNHIMEALARAGELKGVIDS